MKRFLLPAALLLAASTAFAQTATPAPAEQAPAAATPAPHKMRPHNSQKELARMTKQLNLTSDQQAKVQPILADRDQKLDAIRNDTSMTPDAAKAQMHEINKSTHQQLAGVLTPDQLKQMHGGHEGKGQKNTQPLTPPQV